MNRLSLIFKSALVYLSLVEPLLAAGGAHGAVHGVPWSQLIIPQMVNVSIFVLALVFLLRKPVKEFFAGKEAEFFSAVHKAAETKQAAEKAHTAIKARLSSLETNAEASRKEAIRESEEMKQRTIKEAQEAAAKSAAESEKGIFFERERAIAALRTELVNNSVKAAEEQVRIGSDPAALSGLQKSFSQKAASAYRGAQQ